MNKISTENRINPIFRATLMLLAGLTNPSTVTSEGIQIGWMPLRVSGGRL